MRIAKVNQLFLMFAGLQETGGYADLVDAAVSRVLGMLRKGADPDDIRLCFLAAADANLQYRRLIAAGPAVRPTYAGARNDRHDETVQCKLAEQLYAEYKAAAASLLSDDAFVFRTTAEKGGCP